MRALVLLLPTIWLLAFVLVPLGIVLVIAFATSTAEIPPFALGFSGENFRQLIADDFYFFAFLRSLQLAGVSSVFCLLIGYPMALAIARSPVRWRGALLTLVILPFWIGFLLRIIAWIGLLKDDGWINSFLGALGVPGAPFRLLYTGFAMYLGVAYCYLPFMFLPIYARLEKRDLALEEAAADLGASPWRVFRAVTLPLSLPGVWAGFLLVFIPALGEFVIPELLGGPGAETLGRVLWTEFFTNHDWPMASALAIFLLAVLLLPAALWQWWQGRRA